VGVAAAVGRRERGMKKRIIMFRVVKLYHGLISEKMEGFFVNYTLPHIGITVCRGATKASTALVPEGGRRF